MDSSLESRLLSCCYSLGSQLISRGFVILWVICFVFTQSGQKQCLLKLPHPHTHFLSGVFKTLGLHTFSRHNDLEEMVSLKGTNVHNIFAAAFFLSPWPPHLSKNVHFRSLFGEAVSGGGGTSSEPVCSCSQRFLRYSQVTFRPHDLTWSIFLYQL